MRRTKKWLAGLLAAVMALCAMPMALAEDWDKTTDVKNYNELVAALRDDKVEEIKVVGEVTVPAADKALEANKPILVGEDGAFKLAPGAIVTSNVPQGKFFYEDAENTWILVGQSMQAFLLFTKEDGSNYRIMYGTQPDINKVMVNQDLGSLSVLCFNGADVELTNGFDGTVLDVRGGKSLTIAKDVSVKVGNYFNLEGNLTMAAGATLEVPDNNDVDGDATFVSSEQMPENLHVDGAIKQVPAAEEPAPETPETPAAPKFTDVAATSPFAAAIDWAVAQGITLGKTETTFGPTDTCTVSHILTFLWRANGKPGAAEGTADRDAAAKWAVEQEMIAEDADLTAPCTRALAVTFMWKAAASPKSETEISFTDVAEDAEYAPAVAWAVENEITNGTNTEGTLFSPDNTCTRGQIVTFLYRNLAEAEADAAADAK